MSSDGTTEPRRPAPTVFLSYASEDRQAAQSLRDTLPAYGLEVWYDESGLTGGDAWDQKIRRQIRACDFFMPLISAQTEARPEGYFRREWRLAVERTLDMADDHPFLLPVVIDGTSESGARVPDRFLTVQWTRAPGGRPTAALEALCRRLAAGEAAAAPSPPRRTADPPPAGSRPSRTARDYPHFPREEPGQRARFLLQALGWALHCAWVFFMRLPGWLRILIYAWLFVVVLSRGCMPSDRHSDRVSSADDQKIKDIAANYQGSTNEADVAKLGVQIAREFANRSGASTARSELLAVPFSAPAADPAARKIADASFAQMYGRVSISHHGKVGLIDKPMPSLDSAGAAELGRAHHSRYVLYGAIDSQASPPRLTVSIVSAADGSVAWSDSYPVADADPAKIASTVDSKLQGLEDDD